MPKLPKITPKPLRHNNGYKIHFSSHGKQHKVYVGNNQFIAYGLQSRLNDLVAQVRCGLITIPSHLSVKDFLFSQVYNPPKPEVSQQETVAQVSHLIEQYIRHVESPARSLSMNSIKTEKIRVSHLKKFIRYERNDPFLSEIRVEYFDRYKCYRKSVEGGQVKNDTINKELRSFHAMWKFAEDKEWVPSNILKKVKRLQSEVPADRFLSTEQVEEALKKRSLPEDEKREIQRFRYLNLKEIENLIETVEKRLSEKSRWFLPVLITYCYTGIRRAELTNIEWSHINFEKNTMLVKSKKQSKHVREESRTVHLTPKLRQVLLDLKSTSNGGHLVFPSPKSCSSKLSVHTLRSILKRVLKGTKFEGIGYHCFRHSFASNLASAGVDPRVIGSLTGHKTEVMLKHYTHIFDTAKADAIRKLCSLEDERQES